MTDRAPVAPARGVLIPDPPPALVALDVLAGTRSSRSRLAGLIRTARPKQWVKNLLVFAAPGAAGVLTHRTMLVDSLIAFGVFCLAASGSYFLNDVADREIDRRDRIKRHRPVAAGIISTRLALGTGGLLLAAAIGVGLATLSVSFASAVAIYVAINIAYNLRLRHEPVLDLAAVASGFVIRAIAGGLATGVPLSEWFLVVVSFASLFVVAGKREASIAEASGAGDLAPASRISYPAGFLRYVRLLASGVALTAYCLWAFEKTDAAGGGIWFKLTIVPFVLAILRYALLVEGGEGGAPEELLFGDATVLVLIGLWAALFALGVYGT